MRYYLRYTLQYRLVFEILEKLKKKRINFFIDVQSICRGFYNKDTIMVELSRYATEGTPSTILFDELRDFMRDLYKRFKRFDPFFVLFMDDGYNTQNKLIQSNYKAGRKTLNLILEDREADLFREIKHHYFANMQNAFNQSDYFKVFYLKEYESDLIPHFCCMENLFDAKDNDVLNVILSIDKDLLQTCKFGNTIQCITTFKPSKKTEKFLFRAFDRNNAIQYIYENFTPGILGAEYVPLVLAIAGDVSDKIPGLKGIGPKKACDIIVNNKLPPSLSELKQTKLPDIIENNLTLIERNMKLIDFEEQIKRVPRRAFL